MLPYSMSAPALITQRLVAHELRRSEANAQLLVARRAKSNSGSFRTDPGFHGAAYRAPESVVTGTGDSHQQVPRFHAHPQLPGDAGHLAVDLPRSRTPTVHDELPAGEPVQTGGLAAQQEHVDDEPDPGAHSPGGDDGHVEQAV